MNVHPGRALDMMVDEQLEQMESQGEKRKLEQEEASTVELR